ncbi:hypothetical protein [Azoarcus olearius]|uniref:Hypothetical secreted protein n=1 Tax=Azoarcus sp. (strain BH72) TaxID=418699 RepID=A1K1Y7_AZOSB|nr:hypothetical protein [Azoarcus olearius]CAL92842.1 hypothetical secreted protein [Azoarcus olearius]
MTPISSFPLRRGFAALALAAAGAVFASPGAHGPNGEHLDTPSGAVAVSATPRVEAHSEAFELVGKLDHGQFSFFIGRYETNEAVLGATVELEADGLKSIATFRAESGDYLVSDAAMVAALAKPGAHALLFTVETADDSDLLDASLTVADDHAVAHEGGKRGLPLAWTAAGVLGLAAVGTVALRRRKSAPNPSARGGRA